MPGGDGTTSRIARDEADRRVVDVAWFLMSSIFTRQPDAKEDHLCTRSASPQPHAAIRLQPRRCVSRWSQENGYVCYPDTDHMFLLESEDEAEEVYVVHRFFDDTSEQWYGVIAVHPWRGRYSSWWTELYEQNRVEWTSDHRWEDVNPVHAPSNGTIINFDDVREVLRRTQDALAAHLAAGP